MKFWYLAIRTCNKSATVKIGNDHMRTKHLFNVACLKKFGRSKKTTTRWLPQITALMKQNFNHINFDKSESIETCFDKCNIFIIFGFAANAKKTNMLAALLFSADQNRIFVNWLAVSKDVYANKEYGESATSESFQRSRFGKF